MNQIAGAQVEDHDIFGGKRRIERAIAHLKRSAREGTIEQKTGRPRRISPKDCRSILRFVDVLIGQNISDVRVAKYVIILQDLAMWAFDNRTTLIRMNQKKVAELKKWLYSGIYEPRTERDIVITIKRYYQWLKAPKGKYEKWREDHHYPDLVDGLKANLKQSDKKRPSVIEEEEFEALIRATSDIMIKAFLAVAEELGLRPGELLRLLIGNIRHERVIRNGKEEYRVLIDFTDEMTKTVGRRLVVQRSRMLLTQWLETHPYRDDPKAPLWLMTERGRLVCKRWRYDACYRALRRLGEVAGIPRPVHPNIFRHMSATKDAKHNLNEEIMRRKFGWAPGSKMPAVYIELAAQDVNEVLENVYGGVETQKPQPEFVLCPNCRRENPRMNEFCGGCGAPIHEELPLIVEGTDPELMKQQRRIEELEARQEENDERTRRILTKYVQEGKAIPPDVVRVLLGK